MRTPVIFLLMLFFGANVAFGQAAYNNCSDALEICPGVSATVNNINANVTFCPGCEDDFTSCFDNDNSIWLQFTTNATGGDVQIDFTNLVFEVAPGQDTELQATILEVGVPCNAATYTPIGTCEAAAPGNFSLLAFALLPSTIYYVIIDGDNNGPGITDPAECTFDVLLSGTGVDRQASGITMTQTETDICQGDIVTFLASLQDCPDSTEYNWFINGNLVAVTTDSTYSTTALNQGDVVTVSNTCYAQCPVTVSTDSNPMNVVSFTVDAGPDVTIAPGDIVTVNGITTASSFNWTPAYLFADPNALSTLVNPTETVVITLSATENGCTLTDYLTITISTDISIPNTFSPNDDQINDTWEIDGIELYPNNSIKIFDRWGQPVFQTTAYSDDKAWDGTVRGKPASEGVYYYVLDLQEEGTELYKGYITLIR